MNSQNLCLIFSYKQQNGRLVRIGQDFKPPLGKSRQIVFSGEKKFNSRSRVTNFITFMRQSHTEQQFFVPDFIFFFIPPSPPPPPSSLLLPLLSAFTSLAGAGDLHAVGVDQKWSLEIAIAVFPLCSALLNVHSTLIKMWEYVQIKFCQMYI